MDIKTINSSLDYIEKHLHRTLTLEEVAGHVAYSSYHFTRMFSDAVGMTAKRYICKRKVLHVLYETQEGKPMITAAFDYGYEDYSSFYKACMRVFSMSPKACLSKMNFNEPVVFFIGKEEKHEIYIAKLLSVQTLVGVLLIAQLVLALLAGTIMDGFGLSLATITSYLGAFIILGLINVLSSLLSMFLNTSGMVVLVSYIGFMVLNVVGIMVPTLQTISISHMMGQYQMIFSSFSLLLSVIAYYILLSVVGYQLFDKKEAMICLSE